MHSPPVSSNTVDGDAAWGDLLTSYDGNTITYDAMGNPLSDGEWTYTWKHGRQLQSMSKGNTTWTYTYGAGGLRTKRTNGTNTYNYIYSGSQLAMMTAGDHTLYFTYDATGTPLTVKYNRTTYYYKTNLQGDIMAIVDSTGAVVVAYTYDAWGNVTIDGTNPIKVLNPLLYRGYVYDHDTGLYYLQSRYYDPEMGRFINGDCLVSTGQDLLGNNLFAYCGNNPVNRTDPDGYYWEKVKERLEQFKEKLEEIVVMAKAIAAFCVTSIFGFSDEEKMIISTMYGEVGGTGNSSMHRAVGHVFKNQLAEPRDVWSGATTYSDLLKPGRFDAFGGNGYHEMMAYLANRDGSNQHAEQVIWSYLIVFYGNEADFTGGAHYFMSAGTRFEERLMKYPGRYQKLGPFDWCDNENFILYRCLW